MKNGERYESDNTVWIFQTETQSTSVVCTACHATLSSLPAKQKIRCNLYISTEVWREQNAYNFTELILWPSGQTWPQVHATHSQWVSPCQKLPWLATKVQTNATHHLHSPTSQSPLTNSWFTYLCHMNFWDRSHVNCSSGLLIMVKWYLFWCKLGYTVTRFDNGASTTQSRCITTTWTHSDTTDHTNAEKHWCKI